jgi:hypothetical protein
MEPPGIIRDSSGPPKQRGHQNQPGPASPPVTTCAVMFPPFSRIAFVAGPIPSHLDDAIHELGGEVVENVTREQPEIPDDPNDRPEGSESPTPVLAVLKDDPTHYRVFKTPGEVDRAAYALTGLDYADYNANQLVTFVETLHSLDQIAGQTDENDTDEVWDHIAERLDRGRS